MKQAEPSHIQNVQTLPYYPNSQGVYLVLDSNDRVLYVGRSKQLCRRVSHLTAMQRDRSNPAGFSHIKAGMVREIQDHGEQLRVAFIETDESLATEKKLIQMYSPPWNRV